MPFLEADAHTSLSAACEELGIRIESVELIRIGSNAVFRVNSDMIGRVAPDLRGWDNAERQIRVARWLEDVGYPATRALSVKPIDGAGRTVTLWESVSRSEEYAPISDVARLIRELHALDLPGNFFLPELQQIGRAHV